MSLPRLLVALSFLMVWVLPAGAQEPAEAKADEALLRSAGVGSDGPALLQFFRARTLRDVDGKRLAAPVRQLGHDEYEKREQASAALVAAGTPAVSLLRQAVEDKDPEIARRAEACLHALEKAGEPFLVIAAIRQLGRQRPEGAVQVLLDYTPTAREYGTYVLNQIAQVLAEAGFRDGKADLLLVRTLTDRQPVKRALAGDALARSGVAGHRAAVRELLRDPEMEVRRRVGLALAYTRDKEAIPVLIDLLLIEMPVEETSSIEDLLHWLARGNSPPFEARDDEAGRKRRHEAWRTWWKENGPGLDLSKLDPVNRQFGFTLVCQLSQGQGIKGSVFEIDRTGKVRWEIDNLQYPIDAQVLPGNRVLIAEYCGRLVTERNLKGEVLWQYQVRNVFVGAQRLPNGNTFVVSRNQLDEVNAAGQSVWTYTRPGADITASRKLPNGQVVLITRLGQLVHLDDKGKEIKSIAVGGRVSVAGSRFDVLPNGHYLVGLYSLGKVVELDADGKMVWSADTPHPTSVQGLPGGRVLVGNRLSRTIVEIDRTGKVVWQQDAPGRVVQVSRR